MIAPMCEVFRLQTALPPAAAAAVDIARVLTKAGHQALLAGGCVRDLLLGRPPQDYDVATDAPPERVCELFRPTRKVGAQFGVVLVKKRRRWVEVATFRTDGPYLDGRRPSEVQLTDARHDALRRDFTVNGMFLDPLDLKVIDYVGGRADLEAGLLRAIGAPAARFGEDYLRLLRAVRFAARLGFPIEAATLVAIQSHAEMLSRVAAERVRDELEKMLSHPTRRRAWSLLSECGLRPFLWPGARWDAEQIDTIEVFLGRLPSQARFETGLAVLLSACVPAEIARTARLLTLSNEQHRTVAWLVAHAGDLDDPAAPALADLKRLMAEEAFAALRSIVAARYEGLPDGRRRRTVLDQRIAAIDPASVCPPPLVTGDDLLERRVPRGPAYTEMLDTLYTRQLNEELASRTEALRALDALLGSRAE